MLSTLLDISPEPLVDLGQLSGQALGGEAVCAVRAHPTPRSASCGMWNESGNNFSVTSLVERRSNETMPMKCSAQCPAWWKHSETASCFSSFSSH